MKSILSRLAAILAVTAALVLGVHGAAHADISDNDLVDDTTVSVPIYAPITVQDVNLAVLGNIIDTGGILDFDQADQATLIDHGGLGLDTVANDRTSTPDSGDSRPRQVLPNHASSR